MRLNSSRNVPLEIRPPAVKKWSGQLVPVRVGLHAHVIMTKYTFLVSEIALTMTLSSFVGLLAAFV